VVTRVESAPLRIEFEFPDGSQWTGDLSRTANPELARDLALGLVQLVHPLGGVKRRRTAAVYCVAIRRLITSLTEAGFEGDLGALRKRHVLTYWMSASPAHVSLTRNLVQGCGDRVDAELAVFAKGRPVKQRAKSKPLSPYSEREWRELEEGLRQQAQDLVRAHREAMALAELGPDASEGGISRQNLAHLLLKHGPLTATGMAGVTGTTVHVLEKAKTDLIPLRNVLYPTVHDSFTFRMLFGVYCGVVPDGIREVTMNDLTWAGSKTVLMAYDKHRRGLEAVTLPARAQRLLSVWLQVSGPARQHAPAPTAEAVWLFQAARTQVPSYAAELRPIIAPSDVPASKTKPRHRLAERLGLLADDGKPLQLNSARIRTTYHQVLSQRGWTGRTTIDPNHTSKVEGSHYTSALTPAQTEAVEAIIEDAQADVLQKARPPLILTDQEAADFAAGHPGQVARLGLDEGALADLLGGEADVFTASCANQLAGLHGPVGKPCPARPWVCLLCPLAVFLPRHLPNLLRLRAYFARQSRQMTTDHFLAVFGPYADRLNREILPRFAPHLLEAAAPQVADTDAELPLRPEEGTE